MTANNSDYEMISVIWIIWNDNYQICKTIIRQKWCYWKVGEFVLLQSRVSIITIWGYQSGEEEVLGGISIWETVFNRRTPSYNFDRNNYSLGQKFLAIEALGEQVDSSSACHFIFKIWFVYPREMKCRQI